VEVVFVCDNEKQSTLLRKWPGLGIGFSEDLQPAGQHYDQVLRQHITAKVFSFDPEVLAAPTQLRPTAELGPKGENLAVVLDRLRDDHPEIFEDINTTLSDWLPEYDRILFDTPSEGLRAVSLRTKSGQHKIAAMDLSAGTLLALGLMTVAYVPDQPSIIGLEEPDHGIHPRLLRRVQDALYRLAYPREDSGRKPVQVVATTHSPYFLDLFKDHPEEIVIADKTEEGVQFRRLADEPHIQEVLGDAALGEVWYSGVLGGIPVGP